MDEDIEILQQMIVELDRMQGKINDLKQVGIYFIDKLNTQKDASKSISID